MLLSLLHYAVVIFTLVAVQLAGAVPVASAGPVPQAGDALPTSNLYPDPEKCTGDCSWIHDPNVVFERGLYWRFTTSNNITIASAPSLEGPWQIKGPLLDNGTSIHIHNATEQDIWAPSIFRRNGVWFCHYSVSKMGSQHSAIGVAISYGGLEPGQWVDRGNIRLPESVRYNLIDPYVFWDANDQDVGQAYLTFGSYWTGIQQIEIKSPRQMMSFDGTEADIHTIISNTTEAHAVVEGAITYKEGNFFYQFFSVGQCCKRAHELVPPGDEYRVVVCRSEDVTGPYYDKDGKDCMTGNGGTTVLATHGDVYAPGGQGVMIDPETKRTVMYYHYVRPSVGYEAEDFLFGFNYLEWIEGWPVLAPKGYTRPDRKHFTK